MASIASTAEFTDVLDPRFMQITFDAFEEEPDMISTFYTVKSSNLEVERWSSITPMGDMIPFAGLITNDASDQGHNGTATQKEFALGTQIERRLWELDQFDVISRLFTGLGKSARRRMQKDAARIFNNAFSVDTFFGTNSEGVALCSDSHTTNRSGVSTASGFDNNITSALDPTTLSSAITQYRQLKDDAGEQIDESPTHIVYPIDLEDRVTEILETRAGLDALEGNVNVHFQRLSPISWFRLTDANNWFIVNEPMMKRNLMWFNAVEPEFASMEAFDQIIAKYRVYAMYTIGRIDWRWVLGANVS